MPQAGIRTESRKSARLITQRGRNGNAISHSSISRRMRLRAYLHAQISAAFAASIACQPQAHCSRRLTRARPMLCHAEKQNDTMPNAATMSRRSPLGRSSDRLYHKQVRFFLPQLTPEGKSRSCRPVLNVCPLARCRLKKMPCAGECAH